MHDELNRRQQQQHLRKWKGEKVGNNKRPNTTKTTAQWKCEKENIRQENERKITKVFLLFYRSYVQCSLFASVIFQQRHERKNNSVHKKDRICHTMSKGRKQSKSLMLQWKEWKNGTTTVEATAPSSSLSSWTTTTTATTSPCNGQINWIFFEYNRGEKRTEQKMSTLGQKEYKRK